MTTLQQKADLHKFVLLLEAQRAALSRLADEYSKLKKANITSLDSTTGQIITSYDFLFNPSEIQESSSVVWDSINAPGMFGGVQQYVRTENIDISFTLFLAARKANGFIATSNDRLYDLNDHLSLIRSFFRPSILDVKNFYSGFVTPPRLLFTYGRLSIPCVGVSYNVKYSQFSRKLDCLVCEVDIKLQSTFDTQASVDEYLRR